MNDLLNKLLILRTPGIGPVKYMELMAKFGSVDAIVEMMPPSNALRDSVLREMDMAVKLNIHYICDDDPLYPDSLKCIKNHPIVVNVRGNLDTLRKPTISMVGTRHATAAGLKFMADLATGFATRGYAVVSGMAIGTDTAAHSGALRAPGNANTIAVLAGGADYIWPLENERLYFEIIERGLVACDMPVGSVPMANNFVRRNRGIAALSDRLILGEADEKSGSMHTARFAVEYKKEVFAIPSHPSDPRSAGPNRLIREGLATLCMGINDFFEGKGQEKKDKGQEKNSLLDLLGINPVSESVLSLLAGKNISEIKRDLVVLELQGLVRKMDGGYVKS